MSKMSELDKQMFSFVASALLDIIKSDDLDKDEIVFTLELWRDKMEETCKC